MIDPTAQTLDAVASAQSGALDIVQIAGYRILELIGRGGMGEVYLGESELPKRKAAIKLMQGRLDADSLLRFRREMDVLARLQHPNIAQIFEAGTLEIHGQTQPWYAMEFVSGVPLNEYVVRSKLDTRAILALVATIARALHFAHQRGVIHRDIKPDNIVVSADGTPKILDFGIAIMSDDHNSIRQTKAGQIIGTLAYMSPEQLDSAGGVDVRTDVYALGTVLYQLLANKLPLDLNTTSLIEAIKIISTGKRAPLIQMRPDLRGEVCLLVETASHPDITQRYDSASRFADDIDNYLQHRPLRARAPSVGYTFAKFVRRNPLVVAAFGTALSALIGALIWSLVAAERARTAQAQAEQREQEVRAVNDFVADMLSKANPETSGIQVTMAETLAGADQAFKQLQPGTRMRAAVAQMLSEAWFGSGEFAKAAELCEVTLADLKQARVSEQSRMVFDTKIMLLASLNKAGDKDRLEKLFGDSGWFTTKDPTLRAQYDVERTNHLYYKGDLQGALDLANRLLKNRNLLASLDAEAILPTETLRGLSLRQLGKTQEAIAAMEEAIAWADQHFGETHFQTQYVKNALATTLTRAGRIDESIALFENVLKRRQEMLGPRHVSTMTAELNYVNAIALKGDFKRALEFYERMLPTMNERLGEAHATTLELMNSRAYALEEVGQLQAAEQQYRRVIEIYGRRSARKSEDFSVRNNLSMLLVRMGKNVEAVAMFKTLIDDAQRMNGDQHVLVGVFLSNAATADLATGNKAAARAKLNLALPLLEKSFGAEHARVKQARERLQAAG